MCELLKTDNIRQEFLNQVLRRLIHPTCTLKISLFESQLRAQTVNDNILVKNLRN